MPVLPLGLQVTPCRDRTRAVILRRAGLRLESETIGQRSSAALRWSAAARSYKASPPVGILDCRIHFVEECELVEIALCLQPEAV